MDSPDPHSWLVALGAVELALGASLGWVMALGVDRPEAVRRLGIRAMGRVGQAHLDLIIMGVLLVAVGAALPGLPTPVEVALVAGAWVNALLFLPLAWRPGWTGAPAYKVVSAASFLAMTAGTVGVAVHAWP